LPKISKKITAITRPTSKKIIAYFSEP